MSRKDALKDDLIKFSRVVALLFNRSTIYSLEHHYVTQALNDFLTASVPLLKRISPLIIIVNRDQLFVDEEPFQQGTNVSRIVNYFKKAGIQSVSIEEGLTKSELKSFLVVFTSLDTYPNAEAMKRALLVKDVRNIQINHVFFKKVSQDEQIISQEALRSLTPTLSDAENGESRKLLVDMVLGRLLADEFTQDGTFGEVFPGSVPAETGEGGDAAKGGEAPLLHQLEVFGAQMSKHLRQEQGANLTQVASTLLEMKKRLIEGARALALLNTEEPAAGLIPEKINEITDRVILQILRDEYGGGKISLERLAQIVRRLIPEPPELRRLLPAIREVLIEVGMPLTEYLQFVEELGRDVHGENLAHLLRESSETIGVDGELLIEQIQQDPVQAAELILLAGEVKKGAGHQRLLTEVLVEYVERLGHTVDLPLAGMLEGEPHLQQTVHTLRSGISSCLQQAEFKNDLLERLEERFNQRIDDILATAKLDWLRSLSNHQKQPRRRELSVLELLEQTVGEGDELSEILEAVRAKVEENALDANDFASIHAEISAQQAARAQELTARMPLGILNASTLELVLGKELAVAQRYGVAFSALSFSLIRAAPASAGGPSRVSLARVMASIFQRFAKVVRTSDYVGELGRNRIAVLLPMTSGDEARLAIRRCLRLIHERAIDVDGLALMVRLAGVSLSADSCDAPNANAFLKSLANELDKMEKRIRNLQTFW